MKNNKDIEFHYNKACEIAEKEVERLAREILKKNSSLDEFVNAMGVCFFTSKGGNEYDTIYLFDYDTGKPSRKIFTELCDLYTEWNDYLKLTGFAMRFTVDGEKRINW